MNPFLQELAEQHGTPAYCYDLDQNAARAQELQALFPTAANPRLMYSFKSNPLPSVATELRQNGCEADLTSPGEIDAALEAGFDLSCALYGGPGKEMAEIQFALEAGVRQFSIESWNDLSEIAAAARTMNVKATGLLRVNPSQPPKAKLAMAGVASQFGFEQEAFTEADRSHLAAAAAADSVKVKGIHVYWGTQIDGVEALAACFRSGIETAEEVSELLEFPLSILNLGGGFPWPYAKSGERDLSELKSALSEIHAQSGSAKNAEWWFESGRYLSASSGTLLTRVVDLKTSKKDRQYAIVDTGIHHLGGMTGLGRIPRFAIDALPLNPRLGEMTIDLVGQLCTPLDCLARNLTMPTLERGDLLAIPNVGAYGATGSLTGFLSRPAPLEIAYRGTSTVAVHQLRGGHREVFNATHPNLKSIPCNPPQAA